MVELVFSIVVLGIVASLTASIIVQTYESYIIQRAMHRAGLKTELAVNQIANRLAYRINWSLRGSDLTNTSTMPLNQIDSTNADDFPVLEWIGYDNDGFSAKNPPGWSGFVDLNSTRTDHDKIFSLGSDTGFETTVLDNLMGSTGGGSPAIYFMDTYTYRVETNGTSHDYNTACMYAGAAGCMFPVALSGKTMSFISGKGDRATSGEMKYTEFYQLAASAYAVVPESSPTLSGVTVYNLVLHSHYKPWDGDSFPGKGISNVLLKNVSVFRFNQSGDSIRVKICSIEVIGDQHISICKEKAVIR